MFFAISIIIFCGHNNGHKHVIDTNFGENINNKYAEIQIGLKNKNFFTRSTAHGKLTNNTLYM